jgi:exopolysaccharide production protein ExoY
MFSQRFEGQEAGAVIARSNSRRQPLPFADSGLFFESTRLDALFRRRASERFAFRMQMRLKRLGDVVVSGILILLCSPILLIAFVAVRLSSPGPFIFSQPRWGLEGRVFRCYKIRSMYMDGATRLRSQQSSEDRSRGVLLKLQNDPRVTWVGGLLRKTSCDELPQLFNVLMGDMSLVGPRPLMIHMMEPYPEIREVRCVVRPGITGLWQIRNRMHNTSVMDMIADDTEYILRFSLWLDFQILAATPLEVIRGSGAH